MGKESLFTEILETSEEIKLKLDAQRDASIAVVLFYNIFSSRCKRGICGTY